MTNLKTKRQPLAGEHAIAAQAAEWVLMLDEANPQQRQQYQQDFDQWQQADPRHAIAAQRVQGFVAQVSELRSSSQHAAKGAQKALNASLKQAVNRHRKKAASTMLGLLLLITLPAALMLQRYPLQHLNADMYAATGQWQQYTLPDGSQLTFAGKGALDLNFDRQQRTLILLSGEIYLDIAPDVARPFVVQTEFGRIQALGTRFIVNHHSAQATRLSMLESKVRVTPPHASPGTVISAGEQISLSAKGLSPVRSIDVNRQQSRWQKHQLLVQGWTLAEVLSELNRFHPGFIVFNAQDLHHIQVSAVLPLDKPRQALQLLAANFPAIKVENFSPWLVRVSHSKEASQ